MKPLPALALAAALAALGAAAQADTRSSAAIPAPAQGKPVAAEKAMGPRQGFPDTRGLERAGEVADEHARFKRNDSEG